MDKSQRLFFIALLPPQEIQDYAKEIKEYFAQNYDSRHAQKSPPHITLQPPFEWQLDNLPALEQCLKAFADTRLPIPITLKGFGAFVPRVIYINVLKTPELLDLQNDLMAYVEASLGIVDPVSKKRPFAPHMTVAFKDLTKQNFRAAWPEFQHRELEFEFTASHLTLLMHEGRCWNVNSEFPFLEQPS
ncbi:MAG: 2'-5' RNA ligase family protein [Coleofasciculus sp. S288]|nr:2'-5' RNA ligase family protein [Coleofasciculus sp. S288]